MLIEKKLYTKAEFHKFIEQPENADRTFEYIEGEIVEKMASFGQASGIGARITTFVGMYIFQHPDLATFTDAQGGYDFDAEHILVPDVGVILKSRLAELPVNSFVPFIPDFLVEVVSNSDLKDPRNRIEKKIATYLEAGVPLFWYVFPERKVVEVYQQGQPMKVYGMDGTLDGGDVLPGFTLPVRDIFPS